MSNTIALGVVSLKCTVNRDDFLRQLLVAGRAVSSRTSIQVLSGVQIAATSDALHLAATDMEISVRSRLEASVEQEGVAVVPYRLLSDIVRRLQDKEIDLLADDTSFVVKSKRGEYKINTHNPDDFPALPDTRAEVASLPAAAFIETVEAVKRAAGQDESRPVLTGVRMVISPEKITMVATDSYRLSVCETVTETGFSESVETVIPARAVDEVAKIMDNSTTSAAAVSITSNQVVFGVDGTWLTARCIEGQFPNHERLVPESFENLAKIDRKDFLNVIERESVVAQRNSPLRLKFSAGELEVSAATQEGAGQETIEIDYDGEPLEIGFNAEFLKDGILSMKGDVLEIKMTNPLRPGVISDGTDNRFYLIMPVKLPQVN